MSEILCIVMNMVIGALATYLWLRYVGPRYGSKVRAPKFNRRSLIGLAVVVWLLGSTLVSVQSYKTDHAVRSLTQNSQQCFHELVVAANFNNQIRAENDDLSVKQRDALADTQLALYNWLHQLVAPPPAIAALPLNDDRRRDFNLGVTDDFNVVLHDNNVVIADAKHQQDVNDSHRKPLPAATCGLE